MRVKTHLMDSGHGVWLALVLALSSAWFAGCASHPGKTAPMTGVALPPAMSAADQTVVDAHAHYLESVIEDMNDAPETAEQELIKAASLDPASTDLVLELSQRLLQDRHPEKALDVLVKASSLPGATGAVFARLGVIYFQMDKESQAISASQTAIKLSPDLWEPYRTLFLLHSKKGRSKDALAVLNRAAKVPAIADGDPLDLAELYLLLASQVPADKDAMDAAATGLLNRAAAQGTGNSHQQLRLADDYSRAGDSTNAVRVYLELLESNDDPASARVELREKLAEIFLRNKDYARASEQFRGIIQADPANFRAYYFLGSLAEEQKKFAEALDDYGKVVLLADSFEPAYYDLARLQIDENHAADALATLGKAKAKFPAGFVGEILTALALQRQKDFTNAVTHFTAAEVIAKTSDPGRLNGQFYFDEGAAYERAGNFDQAEACFQKSISLSPTNAEALNYLGYMWADKGVKLDNARELIQKALQLEPDSAAYLDSLGWVLYKLNRPQEALPQIQKAIALSEEVDPTLYEHLGDIYAALKQTDKAREAWTKSLSVEPNDLIQKKLEANGGVPSH